MLVFHNCKEGTTDIHINSLHAGNPPIKGEKFAFNLWFREEPTNRII
jgi:prolyl 4-hydroxylase